MDRNNTYSGLIKKIAVVKEDYSLQGFNPFGCGGVADYYTEAKTSVELVMALQTAVELKIPYLVIGRGDNILFSDGGFPGIVIENCSAGYAFSYDKTQMVVDTGMSLDQCITLAAGQGMGGLIPWYNLGGTVGGSLYNDIQSENRSILSMLKNVTVFMPKSPKKDVPSIVKYGSSWLSGGKIEDCVNCTKLKELKKSLGIEVPQPIILSAIFQLTRLRPDEIRFRLQEAHQKNMSQKIARNGDRLFGPVFEEIEGNVLIPLLKEYSVASLAVGNVYPDRYNPNYFRAKGSVQSADIRNLIELIQEKILTGCLIKLVSKYEYLGVW